MSQVCRFLGEFICQNIDFCCYIYTHFPIREKWVITPSSHLINPGLTKYEAEYEATCEARNYVHKYHQGSNPKDCHFA